MAYLVDDGRLARLGRKQSRNLSMYKGQSQLASGDHTQRTTQSIVTIEMQHTRTI